MTSTLPLFSSTSVAITTLVLLVFSIFVSLIILRRILPTTKSIIPPLDLSNHSPSPAVRKLCDKLASALPSRVILPQDTDAFTKAINTHWARQECEAIPAAIIRPRDVAELSTAVSIIKLEYDHRTTTKTVPPTPLFAVRGGGHSPVAGAASISGGVLIDLSQLQDVTLSKDDASVNIGAGAKWRDVSRILDDKGLVVVGGRNSAVGVAGSTLGGGLSFFSPRFGMVCSNIISYELVLASGSITTASEMTNPDLWRALQGGCNNFGIVTRFTARCFPCTSIWSGFIYLFSYQATSVLAAFHESVNMVGFDDYVAGPLACFSYIQAVGLQAIAVNLVYTKSSPEYKTQWPTFWKKSSFSSLWRIWSTCKTRSLTEATDEMHGLNPPGRRQVFATTTVKNDPATLTAVHAVYQDAIPSLRHVKGLVWTLVLQPFQPKWTRQGHSGVKLDNNNDEDAALVLTSFSVNWDENRDDDLVQKTTRQAVEQMDVTAAANGTSHPYRFLNYCASWQRPYDSHDRGDCRGGQDKHHRFLLDVSGKYDPDGLFQKGCVGGFKLGVD